MALHNFRRQFIASVIQLPITDTISSLKLCRQAPADIETNSAFATRPNDAFIRMKGPSFAGILEGQPEKPSTV
jgi:hypothetical protein